MSALNYAPSEIKSQSSPLLLPHSSGCLQLASPLRANTAAALQKFLFHCFSFSLKQSCTFSHLVCHRQTLYLSPPVNTFSI